MEGTTVHVKDKIAYSAMSYIQKARTDGSGGISVEGPNAGAVYAHTLRGGQKDDTGAAIHSEWVPVHMAAVPELVGEDLKAPDALGNLAHPDKIGNPDNIKFSEKLRTRSEEHTSELQSLMRISYAVFCLKKKIKQTINTRHE